MKSITKFIHSMTFFARSLAHKNIKRSAFVLEFLPYLGILEDRFACGCGVTAFLFLVVALRSNLFLNSPNGKPCLLASSLSHSKRCQKGLKLAIGTWIIGNAMSRCMVVDEKNLVVWGKALVGPGNLGISRQSCLLCGRNDAPNQLSGIQQSQWLHFYIVTRIPVCRPSLLLLLGHNSW